MKRTRKLLSVILIFTFIFSTWLGFKNNTVPLYANDNAEIIEQEETINVDNNKLEEVSDESKTKDEQDKVDTAIVEEETEVDDIETPEIQDEVDKTEEDEKENLPVEKEKVEDSEEPIFTEDEIENNEDTSTEDEVSESDDEETPTDESEKDTSETEEEKEDSQENGSEETDKEKKDPSDNIKEGVGEESEEEKKDPSKDIKEGEGDPQDNNDKDEKKDDEDAKKEDLKEEVKKVKVKVRIEGNEHTIAPLREIEVENFPLKPYGFSNVDPSKGPRALHAIIRALELAGVDTKDEEQFYVTSNGNFIEKICGLEMNSINPGMDGWMYWVNNDWAPCGVKDFAIKDGDQIDVIFKEDYMETKAVFFDKTHVKAQVGETVLLKIAFNHFNQEGPISDATILVNDKPYTVDGEIVKTNEKGIAELTFNEPGKYHISAEKKNDEGRRVITRPYSLIEVVEGAKDDTSNDELVEKVVNLIEALPAVDEITLDDKDTIEEARTAYARLTEGQKKLVKNLNKLELVESKIDELEKCKEEKDFEVNLVDIPKSFKLGHDADVTARATNNSDSAKNVLIVIALYDGENTMINYSYIAKTIKQGETESFTAGFRIPKEGNYKVKAFVWDNWNNMNALSNIKVVPVK